MPFLGNLLFDSELEAPKGFRPLSTTQAMMEYGLNIAKLRYIKACLCG